MDSQLTKTTTETLDPLKGKKVAIMQPYFFPYIGYWQLIHAVDTFVIYDDVNYIKQGWIARNRILLNGQEHVITLQLRGASSFVQIKDIEVGENREKLLKTIRQAYANAPYAHEVMSIIASVLLCPEQNLAKYLSFQIKTIAQYLGIDTQIMISSELPTTSKLYGVDRVIAICKDLGARQYINAIGGKSLYDEKIFLHHGLQLSFVRSHEVMYPQFGTWKPWLSIIDVFMFNSPEQICDSLEMYSLE